MFRFLGKQNKEPRKEKRVEGIAGVRHGEEIPVLKRRIGTH